MNPETIGLIGDEALHEREDRLRDSGGERVTEADCGIGAEHVLGLSREFD